MSLKNLIALQKQKTESENTAAPVASPPAEAGAVVESESPETTPATEREKAKPKGLGLNTASSFVKPSGPIPTKTPASQKPKPKPAPVAEPGDFSLEDLAALDAGSIELVRENEGSGFDDEIEATAPDRDLPAELSLEQISFVESLDGLYGILHDPEMFGQSVRMIMLELQENPEYDKLLSDSDVHTMIRGMRRSMGLARVRKQEKTRKGSTQKNARKTSGVSDGAMELLNSLMGGSGDD